MYQVVSPNQKLAAEVSYVEEAGLVCKVTRAGREVLRAENLGLVTDQGIFSGSECAEGEAQKRRLDETYVLPGGKKAVYEAHANEMTLTYPAGGVCFKLIVRVYDDGAAFRFALEGEANLKIIRETTSFRLAPGMTETWLQDWIESYEGLFNPLPWAETEGRHFGMPCLFHGAEEPWVLISEANVYNAGGSYCASHLVGSADRRMTLTFAPEQKEPIAACLPFVSPWRAAIIASDTAQLTASTLICNLNPPSALEDTSWVKPSRNIWGWWFFDTGAQLYTEQLRYVDFAADMGFESVTVDASWDASWVKDLCDYARAKGVSIWIWTTMTDVGTPEKAEKLISQWAGWGVAGVKVDFYINDSQHTMGQYDTVARVTAKHRMMLNNHGCVRPGGEQRTYPHMLTFEGIMGLEHYKWSDFPNGEHHCTVPFTRNVVGPMDYTVIGFSNPNRNTTLAHQLALSVVFDSAVQHYSESIYHLAVWRGTDFLRRTSAKYDGMRMLSGYPGNHAAMMRSCGDSYYLGVITHPAQTLELPLDFLGEGEYQAEVYHDNSTGEVVLMERRVLSANGKITLPLLANGGAAVYIAREITQLAPLNQTGYMTTPSAIVSAQEMELEGNGEMEPCGDEHIALRVDEKVRFAMQVPTDGRCNLRLTYAAARATEVRLDCGGHIKTVKLPATGGNCCYRLMDVYMPFERGELRGVLCAAEAGVLRLREIALVANAQPAKQAYSIELAELGGSAEAQKGPHGEMPLRVVGIGPEGSLTFRHVTAEVEGDYLLDIHYYSGATLPLLIEVNGKNVWETSLLDSSGEATPRWDIPCEKEVKIRLAEGENTLRFFHPASPVVHISGIELSPVFR